MILDVECCSDVRVLIQMRVHRCGGETDHQGVAQAQVVRRSAEKIRAWREPRPTECQSGFTLTDLVVMIGVIILIGLTLLPAQASSRTKSQGVRCLDNLRQIIGAISMFTQDHHDLLPPNPDDGTAVAGYTWCMGEA